jgi:uncharacterized delta-60 repeat protein
MRKAKRTAIGASATLLATAAMAFAAAGDLDATFGNGGVATAAGPGFSWGTQVQADGKVLVGGTDAGNFAVVMRFNADGTLDTGYGSSGFATDADVGGTQDFTMDALGRALVSGRANVTVTTPGKNGKPSSTTISTTVVGRLTTSGAIDTSFGSNGRAAVFCPNGQGSFAKAVVVQPDGKIVVAGITSIVLKAHGFTSYENALFVGRLNANGTVDTSFGSNGVVMDDVTATDDIIYPGCVALQSDGKILVGSICGGSGSYQYPWTIRRFSANGVLDSSFGPVMGGGAMIHSLAVDASDRVYAVGNLFAGSGNDLLCRRYTAGGALDTSFGTGGETSVHYADTSGALKLALQADGKPVFTGGFNATGGPQGAVVVRLEADGALDSTFGTGGIAAPLFVEATTNNALGIDVAPDGRIVVSGYSTAGSGSTFVRTWFAARYAAN